VAVYDPDTVIALDLYVDLCDEVDSTCLTKNHNSCGTPYLLMNTIFTGVYLEHGNLSIVMLPEVVSEVL
jgi:hypothetical protein